ncbi:Stromal cell-derived factor 2-like protein [Sesamum angolense]|uniref:Stromal cell-derived factor 2-like protein n=1 Tax=Sesamum angolense TaxID=2727404 RepID=A0AAE1WLB9_9LAMI|nr:Stromal cell-derived factor 2-like protein [Sesamum angolense]
MLASNDINPQDPNCNAIGSYSELRHRIEAPTVAPSAHQHQHSNLTRRKSAPASAFASASTSEDLVHSAVACHGGFVFGLAIFLLLTLDSDYASAPVSAASEGVQITYGSVIKLMHEKTKFRLHSHDVPYALVVGSSLLLVFLMSMMLTAIGFPVFSGNCCFILQIVRPTADSSAKQGDTIKGGTLIRLQHMRTRRWLHSHLHASPISGNLETYFYLDLKLRKETWRQDQRIRLRHVDTGGYLHSHDKKYTRIAGGQQEVCGVREKRPDNVWLAAEGVYLPIAEKCSVSFYEDIRVETVLKMVLCNFPTGD